MFNKELETFFTPASLAKFLVERADKLLECSKTPPEIIDPFCGNGQILVNALEYYSKYFPKMEVLKRLYGMDFFTENIELTRSRLKDLFDPKDHAEVEEILKTNLFCGDLYSKDAYSFLERTFDLVITNLVLGEYNFQKFYENRMLSGYKHIKESIVSYNKKFNKCLLDLPNHFYDAEYYLFIKFATICKNYSVLAVRRTFMLNHTASQLRRLFFTDFGLKESVTFTNANQIFNFKPELEFIYMAGRMHSKLSGTAKILGKIYDLNDLEKVKRNLDANSLEDQKETPLAFTVDQNMLEKHFAQHAFYIPVIKDQKQLQIAAQLKKTSGPCVELRNISEVRIFEGLHANEFIKSGSGPFKKLSQIPADELPDLEKLYNGDLTQVKKWVPLVSQNLFKHRSNEPLEHLCLNQSNYDNLEFAEACVVARYDNLKSEKVVIRRVPQEANPQRVVVCSVLPPGFWINHTIFAFKTPSKVSTNVLMTLMSSLCVEFILRPIEYVVISNSAILELPIANYHTPFLKIALEPSTPDPAKDALLWLHYGQNAEALDRANLFWALEHYFTELFKYDPKYPSQVIEAYDYYSQQKNLYGVDPTPLFSLKLDL